MTTKLHLLTTALLAFTIAAANASEEPIRVWKDIKGREVIGELVACDNIHVTLRIDNNAKVPVPLSRLSKEDRQFIADWRKENPQAPWIDPEAMPAWPRAVGPGVIKAKPLPADDSSPGFTWRSPHIQISSDMQLPMTVVNEMACLFEATRVAIRSLPLGFQARPGIKKPDQDRFLRRPGRIRHNPDLLRVEFFADERLYANKGAPPGTGGFYNTMLNRTILSLGNLGIQKNESVSRMEYRKSEYVLKHEITHHILHDWSLFLPVWFSEGFAEYIASIPYTQGRYEFVSLDTRMRDYLNKWRYNEDKRRIPIMHTESLMQMDSGEWFARVARGTPILEYNSAAVLVHYFLHHDDKGNAAHLAAWLDAIRQGKSHSEATKTHLLRGRSYAQLDEALRLTWKKNQVILLSPNLVNPFSQ